MTHMSTMGKMYIHIIAGAYQDLVSLVSSYIVYMI